MYKWSGTKNAPVAKRRKSCPRIHTNPQMSSGRNWTKCNFRDLVSAHGLKKEMWVWVNIFCASKINTQMLTVGNTINWWILSTDPCPCDLNDDWYDWYDSYDCSEENPLRTYYPLCWSSCLWSCHNFALTFPPEASWATWWGFWCGCSDLLSLGNYKSPIRSPLNHQPVSLGIHHLEQTAAFPPSSSSSGHCISGELVPPYLWMISSEVGFWLPGSLIWMPPPKPTSPSSNSKSWSKRRLATNLANLHSGE